MKKDEASTKKKLLFITGTRADYGKIKALVKKVDEVDDFEAYVYVSGMHLLPIYGNTYKEVLKDNFKNVYVAFGQRYTESMSYNFGNVVCNLTGYVESIKPDMIIVHGDRGDALAGAVVGALSNIKVGHIEGGEISGTIDDSIRHAISKFAHLHFVSTEKAKTRLEQLGEESGHIFVIGSPDIDIMLKDNQPTLDYVKEYYEIPFDDYGIFMYHPVTTEYDIVGRNIETIVDALLESGRNYIVVYPNNDLGTEVILNELKRLEDHPNFRVYPSLRFEYFLTLLRNTSFVIGNSSAGIRETGIFGIPDIDIGTRQNGRYDIQVLQNIQHVPEDREEILAAIGRVDAFRVKSKEFGKGKSTDLFMNVIRREEIWDCDIQKHFIDIETKEV